MIRLWLLQLLILSTVIVALRAETIGRVIQIHLEDTGRLSRERWSNEHLMVFSAGARQADPASVWLYNRQGQKRIDKTDLVLPEATYVVVRALEATPTGELLVSAEAWGVGGNVAGVLIRVVPPGRIDRVIRTGRFVADSMVVRKGPATQLWLFGSDAVEGRIKEGSYFTVQCYDAANLTLMKETLSREQFGTSFAPSAHGGQGQSKIMSLPGTVIVYGAGKGRWIELGLDGQEIGRFSVARPRSSGTDEMNPFEIASTESGRIFGWFRGKMAPTRDAASGIYELDLGRRQWVLVRATSGPFGGLFGSDGEDLILRSGCCSYGWLAAGSLK